MTVPSIITCLLLCSAAVHGATEPAYGHPDFYPSPQRPLGWRGDGSGSWPGARGVTSWNAETGENIVWRVAMPGAGMAQPLVIGEKVITTADPNLLVCVNVHSGEILWQTAIDHTNNMPPAQAQAAREERAALEALWRTYSQWRFDVQAFVQAAVGAGMTIDNNAALWRRIKGGARMLADDHTSPLMVSILEHADLAQEFRRLHALGSANGFAITEPQQVNSSLFERNSKSLQRIQKANAMFDLWCGDSWEGFLTWSFATPVTDGDLIYVTTVNNAVAAVDLNGRIRWQIWEHRDGSDRLERTGGPLHTRYAASPILADGLLVVNQNGEIRAYDAATGRKRWSIVNPYERLGIPSQGIGQFPFRPIPEAASPCLLRIPLPGGGTLNAVADGGRLLLRLEDGKVLSTDMPYMAKGASPIGHGPYYLWTTGADRGVEVSGGIIKVVAQNRDAVTLETVWECTLSQFGARLEAAATGIVHGGHWYPYFGWRDVHARRIDIANGQHQDYHNHIRVSSCSSIMVGERLYSFPSERFWRRHSNEVTGVIPAQVFDFPSRTRHDSANAFIDRRIFEDQEFALRNRFVGSGDMISNASPSAQANRIFHRTKGYLWCIGNKAEPFPAPRGAPAASRVSRR